MNVLILSCGTRNKLVQYFKSCFDKVIVTDCSDFAPAIYVADGYYIVPRMTAPDYLDVIIDICVKEQIEVVIPLQEDELIYMAQRKQIFADNEIWLVESSYETVALCRDKYMFSQIMEKKGISVIPTYLPEEAEQVLDESGKVMVKDRYGAGSVGNIIIESRHLLKAYLDAAHSELIVQPFLCGKEYGADVYVDKISKKMTSIFVKEKIRMRAGETEKSISVVNEEIYKLIQQVTDTIDFCGPLDIDLIEQNGKLYVLEINPRFGGGYPHAYECGVNFPEYILKNATDGKNTKRIFEYQPGIKCMKYSEIVTV